MDHRMPLKFHTELAFEGMTCHIQEVVGQGSNAIVYRGWYPDGITPELHHHVLIKELFPFHPKGLIRRDPSGVILVEPEAEAVWDIHRASFEAGNRVHLRLLEQHPDLMVMGANLNSFSHNGTLYSVLGYSGGRSLQEVLNQPEQSLRCAAVRMLKLLDALEAFHESGYLHLDISPDNIMLVGSGHREQLFLIDYNSARKTGDLSGGYLSCKPGYSAPEVRTGDEDNIDFSSDLYGVAAVFFRCIMGRTLTLTEALLPRAPDGSDSPMLAGEPQSVCAMVSRILRKGLHTLPAKRYQTIAQLRQAFSELLNRIDGTGITHWALWESGRRSVEERIRMNPALRYLKEDNLYPIRLEREESQLLSRYLEELLSPRGKNAMIIAQGGMGKTTLLLHTAMLQGKRYSPGSPALLYIPLSGWNGSDPAFIRTQILRMLQFGREENTFESAMQALHTLLGQPLKTKTGEIPGVLLLLDGLNELRGETGPLLQEIRELNEMTGVRILAASRSEISALPLETVGLTPLQAEDIEFALGSHGLLIPEDPRMMQLLRTPLILSIYIQASRSQSHLDIHSQQDLMDAYLKNLGLKEQEPLTEDMPQFWQIDAALNLVLPCIAQQLQRQGHTLSDEQLLTTVAECWKLLRSRHPDRRFPQWIGRSRDILAGTQTPEEWYGIVVHNILWQRLGLLIREPEDSYRIFHQLLEEHLARKGKGLIRMGQTLRRILAAVAAVLLAAGLAGGGVHYCNTANARMEKAITNTAAGYQNSGMVYQQLRNMADLALAEDSEEFLVWYPRTMTQLDAARGDSVTTGSYLLWMEEAFGEKSQVTVLWSRLPFDLELAQELLLYSRDQAQYYYEALPVMAAWMESAQMRDACPELARLFSDLVEAEAAVVSELYHQTCAVHLAEAEGRWLGDLQAMTALLTQQEAHRTGQKHDRSASLEDLRVALRQARGAFENRCSFLQGYLP